GPPGMPCSTPAKTLPPCPPSRLRQAALMSAVLPPSANCAASCCMRAYQSNAAGSAIAAGGQPPVGAHGPAGDEAMPSMPPNVSQYWRASDSMSPGEGALAMSPPVWTPILAAALPQARGQGL